MNDQNVKFLEDSLFYLGFSDKLNGQLQAAMLEEKPEFQLQFSNEQAIPGIDAKDKMQYELHFKKGKDTDMYFFNSYAATLTNAHNESREQLFYVNKSRGVTSKEAYNLLSGRAVNKNLVNKEGQKYNGWIQLDFSNKDEHGNYLTNVYHEKYGYKLDEALDRLPIKGKETGLSEQLTSSLKKGNLTPVSFAVEGREVKHFLAANPKFKSMDVFDEKGQLLIYKKNEQQESKNEPEMKSASRKNTVPGMGNGKDKSRKATAPKKTGKPRTRVPEAEAGKSLKK